MKKNHEINPHLLLTVRPSDHRCSCIFLCMIHTRLDLGNNSGMKHECCKGAIHKINLALQFLLGTQYQQYVQRSHFHRPRDSLLLGSASMLLGFNTGLFTETSNILVHPFSFPISSQVYPFLFKRTLLQQERLNNVHIKQMHQLFSQFSVNQVQPIS